jgi:hypothetical protein
VFATAVRARALMCAIASPAFVEQFIGELGAGPEPRRASETPRVLQFDQQLIGVETPSIDDRPHVVVVDHKQVGDG